MFQRIIATAIKDAGIDEAAFDAAIKTAGHKSRLDWFLYAAPASLRDAYNARIAAESETARRTA